MSQGGGGASSNTKLAHPPGPPAGVVNAYSAASSWSLFLWLEAAVFAAADGAVALATSPSVVTRCKLPNDDAYGMAPTPTAKWPYRATKFALAKAAWAAEPAAAARSSTGRPRNTNSCKKRRPNAAAAPPLPLLPPLPPPLPPLAAAASAAEVASAAAHASAH